ncbi:hypothetical protein JYU34_014448 [Plutella xylostella]|uniref:Uncharacterized protein n=1 Tax=Plutella xylostella TaxID=51655 RepID=A0ABQ7Q8B3_PLUXY|nr:hypothetical protein JYU34_014448 [Plutella xylostella]
MVSTEAGGRRACALAGAPESRPRSALGHSQSTRDRAARRSPPIRTNKMFEPP